MTIAIGMFSVDGQLVIGADSEETGETLKRGVDKLNACVFKNGSSLVIAGAGSSCHIDTITQLLQDDFFSLTPTLKNCEAIRERFRKRLGVYYKEHVLCWPSTIEREDNVFSLLMAVSLCSSKKRFTPFLWLTEQNTIRSIFPNAAIGSGRTYAYALLQEHQGCYSSVQSALAAIHILQKVKQDARYCGKETTLWRSVNGRLCPLSQSVIKPAEQLFKEYERLAHRHFYSIVDPEMRSTDRDAEYDKYMVRDVASLREDFRLVAQKMEEENLFSDKIRTT